MSYINILVIYFNVCVLFLSQPILLLFFITKTKQTKTFFYHDETKYQCVKYSSNMNKYLLLLTKVGLPDIQPLK